MPVSRDTSTVRKALKRSDSHYGWIVFAIFVLGFCMLMCGFVGPKYPQLWPHISFIASYWWMEMLAVIALGYAVYAHKVFRGIACMNCPFRFRGRFLDLLLADDAKPRIMFCPGCRIRLDSERPGVDRKRLV
jgi:hypothetical protein